ncbi:diguanylate cyclase (GGDEF) domain-containing protein [Pseudomonas sp. NFIX10]|uniref:diguanylate cyclase domain-containing protein n=1 Tax=Pseudomonas TaxID=286 RepID=UPI0008716A8F|nr:MULTISPECIES: diguanylate cyclase [unclassified Pseudomonas]SCW86267.1 diguanylate cyclase (GGDEF) domain-containing protein [Pseudomonas sp. NFACC56-3]SFB37130.1 diguanylate cyclase (GGDEF) domain-containing protein [Pseudomonas sp. NFIX10]SFF43954.1 diguanylate cyclase (GGDEF) domain-containing protein [Pseudomonas sp. NFACC06-1]SFK47583.1 diguanylate cyclase (GGDEF) domain-containing protein [Pseudomonas sp. NFACC52]
MKQRKPRVRPTLGSVIGRGHLIVALVAITMASVSLTLLGLLALRVYADHNLHLIARSINYTVEAAVVFDDSAAATEALALIASTEEVADAQVLNEHGRLLARWQRPQTGLLSELEVHIAKAFLEKPISLPIVHQGQNVGRIVLAGHGGSLLRFLLSGLAGIILCTAVSAWVALYLARRQLRAITGPLRSLAEVAHAARSERALDRRVPPAAIAELDNLANDFNALLDELESWQTHLQSENETLAHQASHDSLTGLPNRAFFEGRLIRALRNAGKLNEQVAVLYLDSDRFKGINDNFGHAAGDAVLTAVATRVRAQLREDDLVARLGGDEFAVLLAPLHKAEDAERIAEKIIASMEVPIQLPGNASVLTSLSIGIAVYPDHGATPGTLLHAADAAMYQAKRLARGGQHTAGSDHSVADLQTRS